MRRLALALVLLAGLQGCATTQRDCWAWDGHTAADAVRGGVHSVRCDDGTVVQYVAADGGWEVK